jgi:hypothetical protein
MVCSTAHPGYQLNMLKKELHSLRTARFRKGKEIDMTLTLIGTRYMAMFETNEILSIRHAHHSSLNAFRRTLQRPVARLQSYSTRSQAPLSSFFLYLHFARKHDAFGMKAYQRVAAAGGIDFRTGLVNRCVAVGAGPRNLNRSLHRLHLRNASQASQSGASSGPHRRLGGIFAAYPLLSATSFRREPASLLLILRPGIVVV